MDSNARLIAESLEQYKQNTEGWYVCKCPIHEDKNPSLSIKDGEKSSVIFNCFAGCESKDIADYFRLKGFNVDRDKDKSMAVNRKEVCRYPYISDNGELLYEKIRYEPKGFMIVNPITGNGTNGHKNAMYGRHKLAEVKKGGVVYITEGEKDVDFLESLGLVSITSGGATTWNNCNNQLFDGLSVRILPDNDEPGIKFANRVKDELTGIAAKVSIGIIPEKFKDVSDWNCKKEDVLELFEKINFKTISFDDLLNLEIKDDWIIKNYLVSNSICQIFGASGSGKSFFALDMAYCVASGIDFFGNKTKQGKILYIAGEGFAGLKKRASALQNKYKGNIGDGAFEVSIQAAELLSLNSCIDVAERIEMNNGFDLVIIDTLNRNMGNGDENSTQDMTLFISNIDTYIKSMGCAIIIVHHTGLSNPDRARGSGSVYNALDTEFKIEKDDSSNMLVTCTKQKEGESLWTKELKLEPVIVGYDEENESIYSCIINESINIDGTKPKSSRDQCVLDALRQACIEDGIEKDENGTIIYAVTEEQWRESAYKRLDGKKNKRRDFNIAQDSLLKIGSAARFDDLFYTAI